MALTQKELTIVFAAIIGWLLLYPMFNLTFPIVSLATWSNQSTSTTVYVNGTKN